MHAPTTSPPLPGPGNIRELGRLLIGMSMLALGVLVLLGAAGMLDSGRAIDRWWAATIVAAGLLTLAERPRAPGGWRIDLRSTPILGGIDDKTDHTAAPADGAPDLRIDAVGLFGGVDIKHEK